MLFFFMVNNVRQIIYKKEETRATGLLIGSKIVQKIPAAGGFRGQ